MTEWTRGAVQLDHGIYGRPQVAAYIAGGLAIHKRARAPGWAVTHIATGLAVAGHPRYFATKARALEVGDKLLALPIEWARPWDEIKKTFTQHRDAIRAAAFST